MRFLKDIMQRHRANRNAKFEAMHGKGYIFAYVISFNNEKGYGVCEDNLGRKFSLHYTNMLRVQYKILSKNQTVHFLPDTYNGAPTATDIAIVY